MRSSLCRAGLAATELAGIVSSNGTVADRGFIAPEERPALLAYLRKQ